MQWCPGKNLGFSSAGPERLYLPVDPSGDAPTVADQEADPDSLLNTIRRILKFRREEEDLQANGSFEVLHAVKGEPFAYRRGRITIAVNPGLEEMEVPVSPERKEPCFFIGTCRIEGNRFLIGPQSFIAVQL